MPESMRQTWVVSVTWLWQAMVFGGDVLFRGSIGRTDFPGGDLGQLLGGIRAKLWPLIIHQIKQLLGFRNLLWGDLVCEKQVTSTLQAELKIDKLEQPFVLMHLANLLH